MRIFLTLGIAMATTFAAPGKAATICTGNCSIGANVSVGSNNAGNGTLSITDGSVRSVGGAGFIGNNGSNSGTATVTGAGSAFNIGGSSNSQLFIGTNGATGNLHITDSGTVTTNAFDNAPNFGDARVYIGAGGIGTVNINSGGSLIVRDAGSFGTEDGIQLGLGGNTTAGNGVLNVNGTGSVVVRGNSAFINVGQANTLFSGPLAGTGLLNLTNGSHVLIDGTTGYALLSIGRGGNSNGNVTVSGTGSRIDLTGATALIAVGNDLTGGTGTTGVGVLHVTQNGMITTQGTIPGASLAIGLGLGSGLVLVDNGGVVDLHSAIRLSLNSADNNSQTGVLIINDTGVVNATNTFVGNGTNSSINGVLAGTGTLNSNVILQAGGLIDPGLSPGTLTIDGDVTIAGGTLRIEVGGLGDGQIDLLRIRGQGNFVNGFIDFAFINGFLPTAGDSFDFLLAESISGLSNIVFRYSGLAEGFLFNVSNIDNELRFLAVNDGSPVPEPATLALVALGLAGTALGRRCRMN